MSRHICTEAASALGRDKLSALCSGRFISGEAASVSNEYDAGRTEGLWNVLKFNYVRVYVYNLM